MEYHGEVLTALGQWSWYGAIGILKIDYIRMAV